MPININLVPKKYRNRGELYKVYKATYMTSIVATVVFFVGVLVMVGIIVLNSNKISSLTIKQEQLKKEIESRSQEEVKIAFLKQRAKYLADIKEDEHADFERFYDFLQSQGENVSVPQADITGHKVDLIGYSQDIQKVLVFFDEMKESELYSDIKVGNFAFTSTSGFTLSMEFKHGITKN